MRYTKYFFLITMITLFGLINLNGETYTENFDVIGNWSGGAMGSYNAKTYTNSSAPATIVFSSNSSVRETSYTNSSGYSWRLNTGSYDLIAEVSDLTVTGFSFYAARWDNSPVPSITIEYSTNGGDSYSQIETINGSYFTGDKAFRQYSHTFGSPISPESGSTIKIRLNKTTGERLLCDDFVIEYTTGGNLAPVISNIIIDPETNIDYLETVSVSANVTDDDTVSSVVLNWGTTSGSLTNQINMTNSGSTYTTVSDIPAQAKGTTVYYQISAIDNDLEASTSTEASYTVLSNVLPTITNIIQTPNTDITSSTTVSVSADITDSDGTIIGAELHWGTSSGTLSNTIDMSPSSGDTYVTDSNIPAQLNNTTVYYEIYALDSDSESSTSSEQSYEVLDPLPLVADFSANSTTVYVDQVVTFTNLTTGGVAPYSYNWNLGDTNTSTDENPTHTYTAVGTYSVSLTVNDDNTDSDIETKTDYITVEAAPEGATDLFISEYCEPDGGNTKYIEIFNGTGIPVDLSAYTISKISNGGDWGEQELVLTGTLANNDVFVIANSSSDALVLAQADLTEAYICLFNGDDAIGLFNGENLIDAVGTDGDDPGAGWDVAGVTNATANHTLVRKSSVFEGNTDWTSSSGTTTENSEWIVYDANTYTHVGSHVFTFEGETEFGVDFSADLTSGDQPLTVNFTNLVYGGTSPYLFSWDFDGDDIEDSTSENPSYTFTEAGTYTVSLYVIDDEARDSLHVKTEYITVNSTSIESYYASITETSGQALKTQLHNLIATNTLSSYDNSREAMYSTIDNIDGTVTGVYSGLEVAHPYGTTSTPAGIDCEHSYPQSWLEEYESASDYAIARTDIHHLFPTKSEVNSSRGNLPFDNVNSVLNSWTEASGYVSYRGYNIDGETVFEVADQHKGNTARAMLYMNTRWNLPLSDDGSTTGLNIDMLPTLLQWHESDPVDQAEIDRNEGIYDYQGNRNPFVNHPEWVAAIYGSASSSQVSTPEISPNSGSFVNSVEITITCATNGASIYYTTNGDTPTTSSTLYENPFTLTETATVKAIAIKADFDDSGIATATYTLSENQSAASDLFISEYIEGATGSNKALEIFNGTGSDVDLSIYSVKLGANGGTWNSPITLSGTLTNNSVYVIANSSAEDTGITEAVNLSTGSLGFNGNDAVGLFKNDTLIDIIGVYQVDPGEDEGWDVAGTEDATLDHVLVRKSYVSQGNTDWTTSAGTDASDSEWLVYANATYDYLGNHSFTPLTVDFSADLTSTTTGTSIQFTANVTGGISPYAYEWDFNNDSIADSYSVNPTHVYNQSGTYTVSLYVVDNNLDEKTMVKTDYITIESNIVYADDLFISEYLSGTGNNKSIEIYNGTGQDVDLSDYSVRVTNPGGNWVHTVDLSGTLNNDAVFVLSHPSANSAILNLANTTNANINFAGNQAVGLFKSEVAIDIIGVPNALPAGGNSGWTVANIANATYNRTLTRKSNISSGNTDPTEWTGSKSRAGETTPDSEWIVFQEDYFDNIGSHDFDFGDGTLPVTLTSFTSSITYSVYGQAVVSIQWRTEAESGLIGYNILRSESALLSSAVRTNQEIVNATNSLVGNSYHFTDEQVDLHTTYYYWLESVELSNENEIFGPINIKVENTNSNGVVIPYQTTLKSVYPNPFNPTATISFYVKNPDRVKIEVFNIKGQQIKEITNDVFKTGFHKLNWNGKDQNGNDCASGIYFFRMETRTEKQMIKGILMK